MDGASFDELAKAVRAGRTRRQAAGGLLGLGLAVLSSRPLTEAKGKRHAKHKGKGQRGASGPSGKGGNSACAHFCAQVFGADTPAAGQCTSDAAHGNGLCRQCGADVGKACCAPQNGVCPDYTTATCCAGKDTCGGGGESGVCGCTADCTGKNCGDDDGCGGKCDGPCPDQECQTCANGVCHNVDNTTPCGGAGSGLRCCGGKCPPPPPPCVANGTCCDPGETCDTNCCADCCTGHHRAFPPDFICGWTDGNICANNLPGQSCATDHDCGLKFAQVICRCGTCCSLPGSVCGSDRDCCSNNCARLDDGNHACQ